MRDNYVEWRVVIMLLSAFVTGYFCARSEFSYPDGKDREIPALEQLVKQFGYEIATYEVETKDGYILTVFRLLSENKNLHLPVLLQHGIHASAAHFLANERALAYHLHKKGYDVWLGNGRGTKFSRDHISKSAYDPDYWDFSFHEMGVYDIPAVLAFIRENTRARKVHYVAHSMGTTMFLVMGCKKPEELNNIQGVVFLAPVARPKHMGLMEKGFKKKLFDSTLSALNLFGFKKIEVPKNFGKIVRKMCSGDGRAASWCRKKIGGSHPEKFDFDNTLLYKSWWLVDDVPLKSHKHFLQIAKAEKFQEFDYGTKKNKEIYHQAKPPPYELENISTRIYMISGGLDTTASKKDIAWLYHRLSNPWLIQKSFEDFGHGSFNYGMEIENLNKVVEILLDTSERNQDPPIPKETPGEDSSESDSEEESEQLNLMIENPDQNVKGTQDSSGESTEEKEDKKKKKGKGKREESEEGNALGVDHGVLEKLYSAMQTIEKLKDKVLNLERIMKQTTEKFDRLKNTVLHALAMLKIPFLSTGATSPSQTIPDQNSSPEPDAK